MKVFVYFNLHRKCFSVKALEGDRKGRVVAHVRNALVYGPTFKVSEAGRQRVLQEQRKNVHAGVVGQWYEDDYNTETVASWTGRPVTYNPYRFDSFVYKDTETPVTGHHNSAVLYSTGQRATMHVLG